MATSHLCCNYSCECHDLLYLVTSMERSQVVFHFAGAQHPECEGMILASLDSLVEGVAGVDLFVQVRVHACCIIAIRKLVFSRGLAT